jgi:hypothetical protein
MSQTTQSQGNVTPVGGAKKARRARSASAPKPAFVIVQLLDDNDQPMPVRQAQGEGVSLSSAVPRR